MWHSSWHPNFQAVLMKDASQGVSTSEQKRKKHPGRWKSSLLWHSTLTSLTFLLQINGWVYLMGDNCFKVQSLTGMARRNLTITEPFAKSLCTFETLHSSSWASLLPDLCMMKSCVLSNVGYLGFPLPEGASITYLWSSHSWMFDMHEYPKEVWVNRKTYFLPNTKVL